MIKCASLLILLALTACSPLHTATHETDKVLAPIIAETPVSDSLTCFYESGNVGNATIAVGKIQDRTGKNAIYGDGSYVTQGAEYQMVTALYDAIGMNLVNRHSIGIMDWEHQQRHKNNIGNGLVNIQRDHHGNEVPVFVPLPALNGSIRAADFYIEGAITEVDLHPMTSGLELEIAGFGGGRRVYNLRVGMDIVVTHTETGQVLFANQYRKQILGVENKLGLYNLFTSNTFGFSEDLVMINAGSNYIEPVNGAVRWLIESAALESVFAVYGGDSDCVPSNEPLSVDIYRNL